MKHLTMLACLLATLSFAQAEALLPETMCMTPTKDALIVGERGGCKVSLRDFTGKEVRSIAFAVKTVPM